VVKPKKGKGSYKRKQEPDEGWSGIVWWMMN
jgi:stalled ribosome alternative rescue factor ArfA